MRWQIDDDDDNLRSLSIRMHFMLSNDTYDPHP